MGVELASERLKTRSLNSLATASNPENKGGGKDTKGLEKGPKFLNSKEGFYVLSLVTTEGYHSFQHPIK